MKLAASVVIVVAAAFASYTLAGAPYADNLRKLSLQSNTRGADLAEPYVAARTARANIAIAREMLKKHPADADLYMFLAANERIIGLKREAAAAYEEALQILPRSEIYLNLGNLQLEMGQRGVAVDNLTRAVRFEPVLAEEISDPSVRAEVEKRAAIR